jgi:hypothetical protein
LQERITKAARSLNRYLERLLLHCHVKVVLAGISVYTTALIVVILLPS